MVLLLIGFSLDPIGETIPSAIGVGEFMTRTALLSQAIPAIWIWCEEYNKPIPKYYGNWHGKKKRKRREPWYGRRQRQRMRERQKLADLKK